MKKISTIVVLVLALVTNVWADDKADSTYISKWTFGLKNHIPLGSETTPLAAVENKQAYAAIVTDLDPKACDFDAVWNGNNYAAYSISNNVLNPGNHTGDADFKGEYKAFYDDNNLYVFVKFVDDNITGNESVEIPWATYFKLYGKNPWGGDPSKEYVNARYLRYAAFGSYKTAFKSTGFVDAMKIDFDSPNAQGVLTWSGTNENLSSNLSVNNKSVAGAGIVKWIITIGYQAFTSVGFSNETTPLPRPDFNVDIFKELNNKKGLSFDVKVNDKDASDVGQEAHYWWNSNSNDCYSHTWYAGFLGIEEGTAVKNTFENPPVFLKVTSSSIVFAESCNVEIFNAVGTRISISKEINTIDLSTLSKGAYIVRAKNQTLKIIR